MKTCSTCRFADVSSNGSLVCRFYAPKSILAPEGAKFQLVEPGIDSKRVACKDYEEKGK